jgi:hypothetical protein
VSFTAGVPIIGDTDPVTLVLSNPGTLAFSTTISSGWSSIAVFVDGVQRGTLTQFLPTPGSADCTPLSGRRIVVSVAPGTHTFSFQPNAGATFGPSNGTATVGAGECEEWTLHQ